MPTNSMFSLKKKKKFNFAKQLKITKQSTIKQQSKHNQQLNTIFRHSRLPEKAKCPSMLATYGN